MLKIITTDAIKYDAPILINDETRLKSEKRSIQEIETSTLPIPEISQHIQIISIGKATINVITETQQRKKPGNTKLKRGIDRIGRISTKRKVSKRNIKCNNAASAAPARNAQRTKRVSIEPGVIVSGLKVII